MNLFSLFIIQPIWDSSYTFQKMALMEMSPGLILILRYGLASLFFLIGGYFSFEEKFTKKEWGLVFSIGVINFAGSPFFQLQSLQWTYALDVSILVSFEPLITTILAVLILKEKLKAISPAGWFDLFYLSLFCTCLGYGVWTTLLKKLSVHRVALSLFLQPILGGGIAIFMLGEKLSGQTLLGGVMILGSLLVWFALRRP